MSSLQTPLAIKQPSVFKSAFGLFLVTYLWHFPFYEVLDFEQQVRSYEFVKRQMADPFNPHIFDGIQWFSQLAKRAFRFLVPVSLSGLGLGPNAGLVIQHGLGYLFVVQLLRFFRLWSSSQGVAWALTAACCGLFFPNIFTYDTNYHFDGYALVLAITALLTRNYWLKGICVAPMLFIDERSVTTLAMLFLLECFLYQKWNWKTLSAYLLPIVFSFILKGIIDGQTGIASTTGSSISNNLNQGIAVALEIGLWFPMMVAVSLEALLFLLIAQVYKVFENKTYRQPEVLWFGFGLAGFIALVGLTIIVADVSRAISYLFPGILMILVYWVRQTDKDKLLSHSRILALQNFIFPTQYFVGLSAQWVLPIFLHPRSAIWVWKQFMLLFA